jgi:hypothetical protein
MVKHKMTDHHILCKSQSGDSTPQNVIRVTALKHRAYHILFGNRRPEVILQELRVIHKKCEVDYDFKIAWRMVFGDVGPTRAIEALFEEWGFSKYFYGKVQPS